MNKLPLETRVQILSMLCEGSSMRSVLRITGVGIDTVSKLLIDAGLACAPFHDRTVRNVTAKAVQCDEIWRFSYANNKNVKFAKKTPEARSPERRGTSEAATGIIGLLVDHPNSRHTTNKGNRRRFVETPYLLRNRSDATGIVIHGVRHAARRPL
jgi:hypothetical protein